VSGSGSGVAPPAFTGSSGSCCSDTFYLRLAMTFEARPGFQFLELFHWLQPCPESITALIH